MLVDVGGTEVTSVELVKRVYQGFAEGDIPLVLDALDPEVEWTEAEGFPYAGTYVGHDAVLQGVFARLGGEWDGFAAVPDLVIGEGDQVAARGWYSGTYKATNREFKARFVHWMTVRDNKIVRFEQIVDSAKVQEAL